MTAERNGEAYGLLRGRRAVVTGASRGIGRAIAERFAAEGAAVAVADIDAAGAADVAAGLTRTYGVPALGVAMDVADPDGVRAAADAVEAGIGGCDVIVPNAGILVIKPAFEMTDAEFRRVTEVNLSGAFSTATEFGRRLASTGQPGSVIFTSSLMGVRGAPGNAAYAASKFGMVGLMESMAADVAAAGIRVNAVCPGQIETEMLADMFVTRGERSGQTPAQERAAFEQRIPLKRLGSVREVADAYVFLASGLSSYVTGQCLVVDGGWMVG